MDPVLMTLHKTALSVLVGVSVAFSLGGHARLVAQTVEIPGFGVSHLVDLEFVSDIAVPDSSSSFPPGIYFSTYENTTGCTSDDADAIHRLNPDGSLEQVVDLSGLQADPIFIHFADPDGAFGDFLYVVANNYDGCMPGDYGGTVLRVSPSGDFEEFSPLPFDYCFSGGSVDPPAFCEPMSITFPSVGPLGGSCLVSNQEDFGSLFCLSASGDLTVLTGSGGPGNLRAFDLVTTDLIGFDDAIYVSDYNSNLAIRKVDSTGQVGPLWATAEQPQGLAFPPAGSPFGEYLYFSTNSAVYRVDADATVELFASGFVESGSVLGSNLFFCPSGSRLLVSNHVAGTVHEITVPGAFRRGDANGDGNRDASDADAIQDFLFAGGSVPVDCALAPSTDSGDANDNEYLTIADYLALRNANLGLSQLPAPSYACDLDPTSGSVGFDSLNSEYRLSVGDLALLPPVMPTNRRVAFPINVDVPMDVTAITAIVQYDSIALSPFDPATGDPPPIEAVGSYSVVDLGGILVIAIWAENDGETIAVGAPGMFQNVGTLFMHLEDDLVFPPPEFVSDLAVGPVQYRATVVDEEFRDHHPGLVVGDFEFVRGDANRDGSVNIGDPIHILNYLFLDVPEPSCFDAVDGNNDSRIDIADPIYLLSWLFQGGAIIPKPYPECGLDQGPIDFLPCAEGPPGDACFQN